MNRIGERAWIPVNMVWCVMFCDCHWNNMSPVVCFSRDNWRIAKVPHPIHLCHWNHELQLNLIVTGASMSCYQQLSLYWHRFVLPMECIRFRVQSPESLAQMVKAMQVRLLHQSSNSSRNRELWHLDRKLQQKWAIDVELLKTRQIQWKSVHT